MYTPSHARPGRGLARKMLGVVAITASFLVPVTAQSVQAADPSCPVNPDKCYQLTMATSPANPGANQVITITGTLKNLSTKGTGVSIGSANVTYNPADALYDVSNGTLSGSPGTITRNANTFELRNLSIAPGRSASFSFTAKSYQGGTITWSSAVKQANNFAGTGNEFTAYAPTQSTNVSGSCNGTVTYNSYGCKGFLKSLGTHIETGALDSNGLPAVVRAALDVKPINAPGVQVMGLRTYLQGDMCPVDGVGPLPCDWTTQTLNTWAPEYTASGIITMTVRCGSLCDGGLPVLLFQQDEALGITEPILPCALTLLPSLLSGSKVCGEVVNGVATLQNITNDVDYKVMGIALAE
jgi:hypothetical protein